MRSKGFTFTGIMTGITGFLLILPQLLIEAGISQIPIISRFFSSFSIMKILLVLLFHCIIGLVTVWAFAFAPEGINYCHRRFDDDVEKNLHTFGKRFLDWWLWSVIISVAAGILLGKVLLLPITAVGSGMFNILTMTLTRLLSQKWYNQYGN